MLNKLVDKKTLQVNWTYVNTLPEFKALHRGGYHHVYHREGSSFVHTQMVVDEALKISEQLSKHADKYVLICAALLHDIGKGVTNRRLENGDYSAENHAREGGKIARFMLWDEDFKTRERILFLIENHMRALFFGQQDSKGKEKTYTYTRFMQDSRPYFADDYVGIQLLHMLALCDVRGSIKQPDFNTLNKVFSFIIPGFRKRQTELFVEEELGMVNRLLEYHNENSLDITAKIKKCNTRGPKAYVMIGVAGSGKSHYIQNMNLEKVYPVLSRDKVRIDLGYVDENGKFKGNKAQENRVTEVVDQELKELLAAKQTFYYDNMNIRSRYRKEFNKKLRENGYKIIYVLCQTTKEKMCERRCGQIEPDILYKMIRDFDFPLPSECDKMSININ